MSPQGRVGTKVATLDWEPLCLQSSLPPPPILTSQGSGLEGGEGSSCHDVQIFVSATVLADESVWTEAAGDKPSRWFYATVSDSLF